MPKKTHVKSAKNCGKKTEIKKYQNRLEKRRALHF